MISKDAIKNAIRTSAPNGFENPALTDIVAMLYRERDAYREVAMQSGHVCHSAACQPICEMAEFIDAEAQRILDQEKVKEFKPGNTPTAPDISEFPMGPTTVNEK